MTIQQFLKQAQTKLEVANISSAQLDSQLILAHILGKPREYVLAHSDDEISAADQKGADQLVKKRTEHHPLVHLTGKREFYGLDFEITPDVLTPRVETEPMAELVIENAPKNASLLDVGTGSGAIAIAIAKNRPDLQITASDISPKALEVATRNVKMHQIDLKLVESNLLDQIKGKFNVITANLPYLRDDADLIAEVQREPRVALVGGTDGLYLYRQFFNRIGTHLKPGGVVLIEADPWQHADLVKIAHQQELEVARDDYFIMMLQLPA